MKTSWYDPPTLYSDTTSRALRLPDPLQKMGTLSALLQTAPRHVKPAPEFRYCDTIGRTMRSKSAPAPCVPHARRYPAQAPEQRRLRRLRPMSRRQSRAGSEEALRWSSSKVADAVAPLVVPVRPAPAAVAVALAAGPLVAAVAGGDIAPAAGPGAARVPDAACTKTTQRRWRL